ncbi:hypothetical protein J2T56_002049 [Natronobacillus azotifigens]|uniref:Uncharacterized protein n=1 Tax=Natronobacillus azotifigens TaxID=472978 RepID=A0A9J6REL2_9BACI|nr:hypothetical protein [Natronobacillus azotifigens]MCZ0703830.1 hypothetical protein [Natronobacillus azotifigens]
MAEFLLQLTHYGEEEDKESYQWKLQLLQERLPADITSDEAIRIVAERNAAKDIEEVKIGQHQALLKYTSNQGEQLNEIWVATDDYFYSVSAPYLSKSELIDVATSMEFE